MHLGDVDSDGLEVGSQAVSNATSLFILLVPCLKVMLWREMETYLNSSAVQDKTPTLPLVDLSNVGLSIVRRELRDAHGWETVDVDCSVGVDNVGWLGADGCSCLLAGAELDV